MSEQGSHGGASYSEIATPLVFISSRFSAGTGESRRKHHVCTVMSSMKQLRCKLFLLSVFIVKLIKYELSVLICILNVMNAVMSSLVYLIYI